MKFQNIFKRQFKLFLYIIVCLILIISVSSYALFMQIHSSTNNQVISSGDFSLEVKSLKNPINDSSCLKPMNVVDYNQSDRSSCETIIEVKNIGTLATQFQVNVFNDADKNNSTYINHKYVNLKYKSGKSLTTVSPVYNKVYSSQLDKSYGSQGLKIIFPSEYYGWRGLSEYGLYQTTGAKSGDDAKKYNLEQTVLYPGESYFYILDFWVDETKLNTDISNQKLKMKIGIDAVVKSET